MVAASSDVLRLRLNRGPTVYLAERAANRKLAPVDLVARPGGRPQPRSRQPYCSSTTVSIAATCPDACPFKATPEGRNGCFADAGFTGIKGARMDRAAEGRPGLDVMREEAREIERAFGGGAVPQLGYKGRGQDLRLHVGGDVSCAEGAQLLAGAALGWVRRGGGAVWTFTHRWREVPRAAFGAISVLASVETGDAAVEAHAHGYAPALVVDHFPAGRRPIQVGRLKIIPCPAEARGTTCVQCRLCLDQPLHELGLGIAFQVHGPTAVRAAAAVAALMPKGGSMAYAKALEAGHAQVLLEHLQRDGRQSLRDLMAFCKRAMPDAVAGWTDSDLIVCLNAALAKLQASGQVEAKKDLERRVWYHARAGSPAPAPRARQPKAARRPVDAIAEVPAAAPDPPPAPVAQTGPEPGEEGEAEEEAETNDGAYTTADGAVPVIEAEAEAQDDEDQEEAEDDPPPRNIHPSRLMRIAERAQAAGTKAQPTTEADTAEEATMTETMSTSQAARALGIHPSTISNMVEDGRLKTTGARGRGVPLAISRASVEAILGGRKEPAPEAPAKPKAKGKAPAKKPAPAAAEVRPGAATPRAAAVPALGAVDREAIKRRVDLVLGCIEEGLMGPQEAVAALARSLGAPAPYGG